MMNDKYALEQQEILRGDIFMADLSPGLRSEYQGVRPCLVIQNDYGNKFSPTVTVIPLTSVVNKKQLPTHVNVKAGNFGLNKDSTICTEGIRTIDKMRFREKIGHIDNNTMLKVETAMMINLGIFA